MSKFNHHDLCTGPVPLLKMEISRLEEENSKLRSRLENVEMNCSNTLQEKGTLQEQVNMLKSQITSSGAAPSVQISNLKSEVFIITLPWLISILCYMSSAMLILWPPITLRTYDKYFGVILLKWQVCPNIPF